MYHTNDFIDPEPKFRLMEFQIRRSSVDCLAKTNAPHRNGPLERAFCLRASDWSMHIACLKPDAELCLITSSFKEH